MSNDKGRHVRCGTSSQCASVIQEDEEGWEEKYGVHGQIGRAGSGQDEGDAGAVGGLCHGCEDEEVGEGGRGAGQARCEGEGVEEETCDDGHAAPRQVFAGRGEPASDGCGAAVGNLGQGICAEEVDGRVQQVGGEGRAGGIGQQREERQQQRGLVEDAAVVGRDAAGVEEDALLHCARVSRAGPWAWAGGGRRAYIS